MPKTKATHPLQTVAWGNFKQSLGVIVERFENPYGQVFFHSLPGLPFTVGYFPKGPRPTEKLVQKVTRLAHKHRAIFVKFEPNQIFRVWPNTKGKVDPTKFEEKKFDFSSLGLVRASKSLFAPYTFILDISLSFPELLARMHHKTRYNIRLAQRKGVVVEEDNSSSALDVFLRLLFEETTKRQGFYLHNPAYFRQLWRFLFPAKIAHLLLAKYKEEVLAAWIVFVWKDTIYYPYGASSSRHRELMASNLLCWETIRLGKKLGCRYFDMWGCLPPDASLTHPWYGFHRFKIGYGGDLVEFVGSWDLVLNWPFYRLYNVADKWRWRFLHLKKRLLARRISR